MSEESSSTVPTAPANRSDYWQPHIDAWRASGVSAKRFCNQNALPYGQFLYWVKKRNTLAAAKAAPNAFARVVPVTSGSCSGLTLRLPNGMQVSGIDAETMALLPQLLAQL